MKKNTDNLQSEELKARREQFFKKTAEMREQCKDVDPDILEQEIPEASINIRKGLTTDPFYSVEEILKTLHKNTSRNKSNKIFR